MMAWHAAASCRKGWGYVCAGTTQATNNHRYTHRLPMTQDHSTVKQSQHACAVLPLACHNTCYDTVHCQPSQSVLSTFPANLSHLTAKWHSLAWLKAGSASSSADAHRIVSIHACIEGEHWPSLHAHGTHHVNILLSALQPQRTSAPVTGQINQLHKELHSSSGCT